MQGGGASGKTWSSLDNEEEGESAQIFWVEGIKGNMSDFEHISTYYFSFFCTVV